MTVERAPASIAQVIITHLRRRLQDPTHNPNGVPNRTLGWTDGELFAAINDTIRYMQLEAGSTSLDDALAALDITYTEDDDALGSLLPSSLNDLNIFTIHDISAQNIVPVIVKRGGPDDVMQLNVSLTSAPLTLSSSNQRFFVRVDGLNNYLVIRPRPANGRAYRIWYVAAARQIDSPSDIVPMAAQFSNLIVLHTFLGLVDGRRSPDELRESIMQRDNEMRLFKRWASAVRGPRQIANMRKGPRY